MADYPQVVLFGSIPGGWREQYIIPVLDELGVSYYNPVQQHGWTPESGAREAEVMAHAEVVVIVINNVSGSYTGLAESGWAALGARERGQTLIFYVMQDAYTVKIPVYLRWSRFVRAMAHSYEHYARSLRYLMQAHARQFDLPNMHVVDSMDAVIAALRARYPAKS